MPRRGRRTEASRAELPKQEAGLTGERSAAADGAHGAASQPLRGASSSSRPGEDAAPTDGPSRTPAPSSQQRGRFRPALSFEPALSRLRSRHPPSLDDGRVRAGPPTATLPRDVPLLAGATGSSLTAGSRPGRPRPGGAGEPACVRGVSTRRPQLPTFRPGRHRGAAAPAQPTPGGARTPAALRPDRSRRGHAGRRRHPAPIARADGTGRWVDPVQRACPWQGLASASGTGVPRRLLRRQLPFSGAPLRVVSAV